MNKQTFVLNIEKVNTKINANGKVSIKTEEGKEVNPRGLFQFTEKHLDNLADGVGALNCDMLRNAIASGFDDSQLEVDAEYVKEGDNVLDQNGEEVIDLATNEPMKYTKDHWKVHNYRLILGEDATEYITSLNQRVDEMELMESRKEKRRNKRRKTATVAQSNEVANATAEAEDADL